MYVLVNIGCIECMVSSNIVGVSSNIVGVYEDMQIAKNHAKELNKKMHWREGGQNSFEVFALPKAGEINEEYRAALSKANGEAL